MSPAALSTTMQAKIINTTRKWNALTITALRDNSIETDKNYS